MSSSIVSVVLTAIDSSSVAGLPAFLTATRTPKDSAESGVGSNNDTVEVDDIWEAPAASVLACCGIFATTFEIG